MNRPAFTIDKPARERIQALKAEAARTYSCAPDDCVARFVSVGKPRLVAPDSALGKALVSGQSAEVIAGLVQADVLRAEDESDTQFEIELLGLSEVSGYETIMIDEIEFCMPMDMYEGLRGYVLAWEQDCWTLTVRTNKTPPSGTS
jgi:hypothetical protein